MKGSKRKSKMETGDQEDAEYEKIIDEFADLVAEELKEEQHSDLEPFEVYAARIKSKIHTNVNEFRERFSKGYHVLLKELEKEHTGRREPPGPGAIRP